MKRIHFKICHLMRPATPSVGYELIVADHAIMRYAITKVQQLVKVGSRSERGSYLKDTGYWKCYDVVSGVCVLPGTRDRTCRDTAKRAAYLLRQVPEASIQRLIRKTLVSYAKYQLGS